MGAKNPDRIPIEDWRGGFETVAQMQAAEWEIMAKCRKCRIELKVSLDIVAWHAGPKASLWNRTTPCRRLRCDGLMTFHAKIPRVGMYQELEAPIPRSRRGSVTLSALAAEESTIHIYCRAPGCRERQMIGGLPGGTLTAREAAAKWGADLTLADIQERWRCPVCGHRGKDIYVEPGLNFHPKMGLG